MYFLLTGLLAAGCLVAEEPQQNGASEVEVRQIEPMDDEIVEEWERVTDDPDIHGVGAARFAGTEWPWQVYVYVAEFVRTEPLESELRRRITDALNSVPGVTEAVQEDREVWVVQGDASGDALTRACAAVVDELATRTREVYESL